MANALQRNRTLKYLSLRGNGLGPEGAERLSAGVT